MNPKLKQLLEDSGCGSSEDVQKEWIEHAAFIAALLSNYYTDVETVSGLVRSSKVMYQLIENGKAGEG